eukprot:TRINITY_DN1678_c0_g1_i1.p2 TRINITY_DN1678_c0_g1~~TRINITY_DN1678_c0_g1_i1.p2  ORF type:complete len:120 (+),score=24.09 TRINITY_DN1678_c0_g1_i1:185-544(+)
MNFEKLTYDLFVKITRGETEQVKTLFETHHLDTELFLNKFEWTPLHAACFKGNMDLAVFLLERGANVLAENQSGYTPLMLAERYGHHGLVDLLSHRREISLQSRSPRQNLADHWKRCKS